MELTLGNSYYGFEVIKTGEIKDVGVKYWQLLHKVSGATLIYTDRDDGQMVFSAGFRTLPEDDTGVFHIIEHSCLDGSQMYQLKEPFVNIICSSLAVDLNAVTYPDKTFYYFASTNEKDYMNLMSVYLDAVFHPLMLTDRRIFEKEAWHLEPDSNGGLIYNGVVFNEMQGHENMADSILEEGIQSALFPNNCYSKNSGGRPTAIPELTYEQFCDTYKRFYGTKNCTIYMSGKMKISEELAYIDSVLCGVEDYGYQPPVAIDAHPPVCAPNVTVSYQISDNDTPAMNTRLAFSTVIGDGEDSADVLGMKILSSYLAMTPTSPLSRAVLDADIGQDFSMAVDSYYRQPTVNFLLAKSEPENAEKLKDVIFETLRALIKDGLDVDKLADLLAGEEVNSRRQALSVDTGIGLMESILRDIAQFGYIRDDDSRSELVQRFNSDNKYFDRLIEKYILNNPHFALVRCVPATDVLTKKKDYLNARLDRELEAIKAVDGAYAELEQNLIAFKEYLGAPDSPEAVATVPHITLDDISRENRLTDITQGEATLKNGKDIKSLIYEGSSQGIILAGLVFDLKSIPTEDLFYVSCLSKAVFALPTQEHTALQINDMWIKLKAQPTAGVSAYHVMSGARVVLNLGLDVPTESIKDAAALMRECMTSLVFDREILTRLFSNSALVKDEMIWSGNRTAANYASRCINLADAYNDILSGVSFYQRLKLLSDSINAPDKAHGENIDTLIAGMERVYRRLFASGSPIAYYIGDSGAYSEWQSALSDMDICPLDPQSEYQLAMPESANCALALSGDVNYCARVYDAKAAGYQVTNRYQPVCRYLYGKFMWDEVRAKGGAYGAGISVTRYGLIKMHSYRDPRVKETYEIYGELADWMRRNMPDREEIERNIISCAGSTCFMPQSVLDRGREALTRYLCSRKADDMWKLITELFDTTEEDFISFADMISGLEQKKAGIMCALGNRAKIEESGLFQEVIDL